MDILQTKNLCKTFKDHNNTVHAVNNVTMDVELGEMVAIIGPSGSGKTTLLNLMGIVLAPDSGEVILDGRDLTTCTDGERCRLRNKYFGYIVQDFALIEEDTAIKNIMVPTLYSKKKVTKAEYRERINALAQRLDVKDLLKKSVKKLSGGERQKIAIIRSLICDPQIILADEPTGALDRENSIVVLEYLRQIVDKDNKAVIIVTHDLNIARQCDRVYRLTRGQLEHCSPDEI